MTQDERIEQLLTEPPRIELTPMQKVLRVILVISAVVSVISLVIGIRNFQELSDQSDRTTAQSKCTNANLGYRALLANADHQNERMKILGQKRAEVDQKTGLAILAHARGNQAAALAGFQLYQRGTAEFVAALDGWIQRDDEITAKKRQHPLGRC